MQPGEYRVEAEAPGFKRLLREAISLQVQETAVVNLQLELGELSQVTTVTAAEASSSHSHHSAPSFVQMCSTESNKSASHRA